jgi:hypothetical protein
VIDFHPIGGPFRAAQINGLSQALESSGDGGTVIANAPKVGTMTHEPGYRFLGTGAR